MSTQCRTMYSAQQICGDSGRGSKGSSFQPLCSTLLHQHCVAHCSFNIVQHTALSLCCSAQCSINIVQLTVQHIVCHTALVKPTASNIVTSSVVSSVWIVDCGIITAQHWGGKLDTGGNFRLKRVSAERLHCSLLSALSQQKRHQQMIIQIFKKIWSGFMLKLASSS